MLRKPEFYILYYLLITVGGSIFAYVIGPGKYNFIPLSYLFSGPFILTIGVYKNIDTSISRLKRLDKEVFMSYTNRWGITEAENLNALNMLLYSGNIHRLSDKKLNRIVSFTRTSIIAAILSVPSLIWIIIAAYKF